MSETPAISNQVFLKLSLVHCIFEKIHNNGVDIKTPHRHINNIISLIFKQGDFKTMI